MENKISYRIISLTMAFLLLLSSSGISMDVHFCQGKFKRANLLGKAKTCEQVNDCLIKCGKEIKSCHSDGEDGDHKGCCENQSVQLDLDFDAADITPTDLSKTQKQFLTAFTYTYVLNLVPTKDKPKFTTYIPPPLEKDISILFQIFRL